MLNKKFQQCLTGVLRYFNVFNYFSSEENILVEVSLAMQKQTKIALCSLYIVQSTLGSCF